MELQGSARRHQLGWMHGWPGRWGLPWGERGAEEVHLGTAPLALLPPEDPSTLGAGDLLQEISWGCPLVPLGCFLLVPHLWQGIAAHLPSGRGCTHSSPERVAG